MVGDPGAVLEDQDLIEMDQDLTAQVAQALMVQVVQDLTGQVAQVLMAVVQALVPAVVAQVLVQVLAVVGRVSVQGSAAAQPLHQQLPSPAASAALAAAVQMPRPSPRQVLAVRSSSREWS